MRYLRERRERRSCKFKFDFAPGLARVRDREPIRNAAGRGLVSRQLTVLPRIRVERGENNPGRAAENHPDSGRIGVTGGRRDGYSRVRRYSR